MKRKLYFCGAPYEVQNQDTMPTHNKFELTGRNTGNLLIGYGLRSILKSEACYARSYTDNPQWIRENFDALVIPAANFIFRSFDFGYLADLIEKVDLPVLVAGLGAQASGDGFDIKQIPEGTLRFVKVAAERSQSIAVRGSFSAEIVSSLGVKNVRILGCPSLLTTKAHSIQIRRPRIDDANICINGSRNVTGHSFDPASALRVERQILEYGVRHDLPYVYQNEVPELLLCEGEVTENLDDNLKGICKKLQTAIAPLEFQGYIKAQGKVFFSVDSWLEWIKSFNFVIGTRFHGNMIAMLAGVPSMVLTHDSRTKEMCETIGFPAISVTDIGEFDPYTLIASANYEAFEKKYIEIRKGFFDFFDENGFEHHL